MSRFVGLSLMCLMFMSAQADDQFSGSSWVFQSYQDGDGKGQFQSENQEFDETGVIKHDRVKGDIRNGVCKVTSKEDLRDSAESKFPFFFRYNKNQGTKPDRWFHKTGENSKWIYPLAEHQRPTNSTEANLKERSKVMFGNLFKSKKRKCEEERGFRKDLKIGAPFDAFFKMDREHPVKPRHEQRMDQRFDPCPANELIRIRKDMQHQMEELKKQNRILMKRMQNFEKYFFRDYFED